MAPPRNSNNNENVANNIIDEQQEARMNEIDDILAGEEQEQPGQENEEFDRNDPNNIILLDDEENVIENRNEDENEIENEIDNEINNENKSEIENEVDKKKDEQQKIEDSVNITMFMDKLNTFNSMYKTNIDANKFVDSVMTAWGLLEDEVEDRNDRLEGWGTLGDAFRDALTEAFAVERAISYKEHRLPDYAEIIRSLNHLLRVAMFNFTDVYSNREKSHMFAPTAFGGLTAKDLAMLTKGESNWSMDQKSDKAWEIQSADAKDIAAVWQKDKDPLEKLLNEMNALAESSNGRIADADHRDIYNKLAAAEWMLLNNEDMMIESSENPGEKIPNWGNKYWKAILQAREALGVPKHISMRELIQGDYAESSKAVNDVNFNERQFQDHLLDPEVRGMFDSKDVQESEFKIQREEIRLNRTDSDDIESNIDLDAIRYRYPVKEENEFLKHRNSEKVNNFILDKSAQKEYEHNLV